MFFFDDWGLKGFRKVQILPSPLNVMTMQKKKFMQDTLLGLAIATAVGAIMWFVVGFLVYEWNHTLFFLRPENAHYTEYNTPVQIIQLLYISAYQDPLSIAAFFVPFVILAIIMILTIRYGEYRHN